MYNRKDKLVIIIMLTISIICFIGVVLTHAQDFNDYHMYNNKKTIIGVDYYIDNIWCNQFKGEITRINQTAFTVKWFRYGDNISIKQDYFNYKASNNYKVTVDIIYSDNETSTVGVFTVYWFRFNKVVGKQNVRYSLKPRDNNLHIVSIEEIKRVRKYTYEVGLFV